MFQKTVSSIAIIILILSLCFIGIMLYRQKSTASYPPVLPNCPDYWDASGNICINPPEMNLGNGKCPTRMDFTTARWNGSNSTCAKYKWAKTCNLTWDGITDKVSLCET